MTKSLKTKRPPIFCIVGQSGSGKTTYIEKLIPELRRKGLKVGTIKHHHGNFELDRPGKDSWRHRHAGSVSTIIASPSQIGLVMDADHDYEPDELVSYFPEVDIILAEGYKHIRKPKAEIFRPEVHDHPVCVEDRHLVALITDSDIDLGVPRFNTSDAKAFASYLIQRLGL